MPDRVANPAQTADLIEQAREAGFAPGLALLADRMAALAAQAEAELPGTAGRAMALANILLLTAEVNRSVAVELSTVLVPRA